MVKYEETVWLLISIRMHHLAWKKKKVRLSPLPQFHDWKMDICNFK